MHSWLIKLCLHMLDKWGPTIFQYMKTCSTMFCFNLISPTNIVYFLHGAIVAHFLFHLTFVAHILCSTSFFSFLFILFFFCLCSVCFAPSALLFPLSLHSLNSLCCFLSMPLSLCVLSSLYSLNISASPPSSSLPPETDSSWVSAFCTTSCS